MLFFSYCHEFCHKCNNFGAIMDQSKVTDTRYPTLKWNDILPDFIIQIFTDIYFTDIIFSFTDIINHAKASRLHRALNVRDNYVR